jgi:ADP-heptose:LPS heptosyltransferase
MDRRVKTTRLLVIHPGALGDTLLALPVLAGLKRRHAPATLDLIGHPSLVEVLPGRSVVDRMRSIDGPEVRCLYGDRHDMPSALRAYLGRFDVAVAWLADQDGDLRHALRALGGRRVIVRSPRLRDAGDRHATDRFADTLSEWGRLHPLPAIGLTPTTADSITGAAWLAKTGIVVKETPVIAVHPGSGSSGKCWSAEWYAEAGADLLENGTAVLLIEGPADAEAVVALQQTLGSKRLPRLAGVGLTTVIGVLSQCRAFLGNDSGLTHLAAALGVPTVGVYGPTDPAIWAPRGEHVTTFRSDSGCRSVPPRIVTAALLRVAREPSASLAT